MYAMNVGEWTKRWSDRYPDEPFVKYGELLLTRKEFNSRINRFANAFLECGIKKGDRVAALMANSNVFLEILFALSKIGGIMVPLNFRLAAPELEFILNDSEPMMMIYSPEFLQLVGDLRGKVPSIKKYMCEMEGGAQEDALIEKWISSKSEMEPVPKVDVTMDDPHFIMYTSGTTGKPKGAVVLQQNTQWNAINGIHIYSLNSGYVSLCAAPLFHIGALHASATPGLYAGAKTVIQRFFNPNETLKLIEKEKVNLMFGIPVMFLFMMLDKDFENTDFSSVEFFIAGGSPCPTSLIDSYLKKGVTFNQGYGMTETATAITALKSVDATRKAGSCGKPVFHTDVKILNLDGKDCPRGDIGEVLIKGPNVIREYWRRPKESAETIVDGWLKSGDMGYFDDEGYLFLVDRKKDMYISGGENVYPAEVEDVLMKNAKVADAGVIGIPDDKWGEVGMAVIVKKPGMDITEQELIDFCKNKLAKYKIPKKVVFTDALPRTATGKILKKTLREQFH
jgi:fatty-acyl-CoA synthase